MQQLREALSVHVGQQYFQPERVVNGIERLTIWCENLVQIEDTDETVHFSHHSIRKFLLQPSKGPLKGFHVDLPAVDHYVGEICLTYLDFNDFKTALIERPPGPRKTKLDHGKYPAGIAEQTVQQTIPGVSGSRVARLLKKSFKTPTHQHSTVLELPAKKKVDSQRSTNIVENHPFLNYAEVHWLFHTKKLSPSNSSTWLLFKAMIVSDALPWTDPSWSPPGMPDLGSGSQLEWKWDSMDDSTFALHKAVV